MTGRYACRSAKHCGRRCGQVKFIIITTPSPIVSSDAAVHEFRRRLAAAIVKLIRFFSLLLTLKFVLIDFCILLLSIEITSIAH